ncbi:MAG: hypothetical protein ACP5KE_02395 [Candidatus Methanodesulfokora sp.]|nr:MAG: hypothetical protein C0200_02730 [Candidatus Korarchaeota archaeon]
MHQVVSTALIMSLGLLILLISASTVKEILISMESYKERKCVRAVLYALEEIVSISSGGGKGDVQINLPCKVKIRGDSCILVSAGSESMHHCFPVKIRDLDIEIEGSGFLTSEWREGEVIIGWRG